MDIAEFAKARIMAIFHSKAALARLRRGIGKEIGEIPELLEFVIPSENLTTNAESERMAENALYTTFTLYAFHQQGCIQCMSSGLEKNDSNTFGKAVRKLVNGDNEIAVTRRFNQVLTAKDVTELAVHARGLIGLLKRDGILLNYPSFAKDLYWFQQENYRRNVLLNWGRDYYMNKRKDD